MVSETDKSPIYVHRGYSHVDVLGFTVSVVALIRDTEPEPELAT